MSATLLIWKVIPYHSVNGRTDRFSHVLINLNCASIVVSSNLLSGVTSPC
jgi:hypothetical protein